MELSAGTERRGSRGGSEGGSGTQVLATRVRESAGQPVGSERAGGGESPLTGGLLLDPATGSGPGRGSRPGRQDGTPLPHRSLCGRLLTVRWEGRK